MGKKLFRKKIVSSQISSKGSKRAKMLENCLLRGYINSHFPVETELGSFVNNGKKFRKKYFASISLL